MLISSKKCNRRFLQHLGWNNLVRENKCHLFTQNFGYSIFKARFPPHWTQRTFSSLTSDRPFMVPLPPSTNTEAAWRPTAAVALIGKGLHSKDLKLLPDIYKDSKTANRPSLQRSVKPKGARRMCPMTGRRCRGEGRRFWTLMGLRVKPLWF